MISFKQYLNESIEFLTPSEFKRIISGDPSWCEKLTHKVKILGKLDLSWSNITHLSPLLTVEAPRTSSLFSVADFSHCLKLQNAAGNYNGFVNFSSSSIEVIDKLIVAGDALRQSAAWFCECPNLRVAEGTYSSGVDFSFSGVERIGNLKFTRPHTQKTTFFDCGKLQVATGNYLGKVSFMSSAVHSIENLSVEPHPEITDWSADFRNCDVQSISNFNCKGEIRADPKTLAKIQQYLGQEKAGGKGEFDDLF